MVNTRKTKKAKNFRIKRGGYNPDISPPYGYNIKDLKKDIRALEDPTVSVRRKELALPSILLTGQVLNQHLGDGNNINRKIHDLRAKLRDLSNIDNTGSPIIDFENPRKNHHNVIAIIIEIAKIMIEKFRELNEEAHKSHTRT